MDPIILLILTVTLNALVTGILIFVFQKRLESKLGRENFEHQTKFSDTYAKRVKTLEDLCRSYDLLLKACLELVTLAKTRRDFRDKKLQPNYETFREKYRKNILAKHIDFNEIYVSSRLFLSNHADEIVFAVFVDTLLMEEAISTIAEKALIRSVPKKWIERLSRLEGFKNLKTSDMKDPKIILGNLENELANCSF